MSEQAMDDALRLNMSYEAMVGLVVEAGAYYHYCAHTDNDVFRNHASQRLMAYGFPECI